MTVSYEITNDRDFQPVDEGFPFISDSPADHNFGDSVGLIQAVEIRKSAW